MPFPRHIRGVLAAAGCTPFALGVTAVSAQTSDAPHPTSHDRWTVDAQYLHVGAAPIRRHAGASMGLTIARALGSRDPARALQLEGGWLRASRVQTQVQGVTLGLSAGLPVGSSLTVRPGAAMLAGWAEAQDVTSAYDWRGMPNTADVGQSGTEQFLRPVRGRAAGAGASLGADLRLASGVSIVGSVREWMFTGAVIRPNRHATLAGVGVAVRPRAVAAGARAWWHDGETVGTPATSLAPAATTTATTGGAR